MSANQNNEKNTNPYIVLILSVVGTLSLVRWHKTNQKQESTVSVRDSL